MVFDQILTRTDDVALTVIGVEDIAWKGQNNSVNDDNNLDADPNFPEGLGVEARRVFPDARFVDGAVEMDPRDTVNAEITLSVQPVEPVNIYLRSFDVDDPTADTGPIDGPDVFSFEAQEEDNRGTAPAKSGRFAGAAVDGILDERFANKQEIVGFQTTMQPGDNFRLVANGDRDYVSRLTNDDNSQDVGGSNTERNLNKQRIVDPNVAGAAAAQEVRDAGKYVSDVLTVWRRLTVEVDSMGAPPASAVFPDDGEANDVAPPAAGVPPPNTGLLADAFRPAHVQVVLGTPFDRNNVPFDYHLSDADYLLQGVARGIPEPDSGIFWSAYVLGAYEPETTRDGDGADAENPMVGATYRHENEFTYIFQEVIRDVTTDEHPDWDRDLVEMRVVVHEVGHQFELDHGPGVMWGFADPAVQTSEFSWENLAAIRSITRV